MNPRASVTLFILILFLMALRMFVGADPFDESIYPAISYRFLLGDRPFVDEFNFVQIGSLVLQPFISLFYKIRGNMDGVLLYCRFLFLLFCGLQAFVVIRTLAPFTGKRAAWLFALLPVLFTPYQIPSLSYNTLGAGFFLIGTLLNYGGRGRIAFLAIGFSFALASTVYPTLVLPSLLSLAVCRPSGQKFKGILLGAATWLVLFLPHLIPLNAEGLLRARQYLTTMSYGEASLPHWAPLTLGKREWFLLLGLFSVPFLGKIRKHWLALLVLAVPALAGSFGWRDTGFILYLSFAALPCLYWLREDSITRELFLKVWCPSLVAGLAFAMTSDKGMGVMACGMTGAGLVTLALISRFKERHAPRGRVSAELFVGLSTVFILAKAQVLRLPNERLVAIPSGPAQGLWENRERVKKWAAIEADLKTLKRPNLRIAFIPMFPMGYLMTEMRPYTFSINGIHAASVTSLFADHHKTIAKDRVILVSMRVEGINTPTSAEKAFAAKQIPLVERDGYAIFWGTSMNTRLYSSQLRSGRARAKDG